jgi:hypothetical protein
MDPDTLRVLLAADDPVQCEAPPGFDWEVEIEKVRELAPVLEHVTGRKFEVDDQVQDASFFAELGTYEDFPDAHGGKLRLAVLAVSFSSFGKLFTVWSAKGDEGRHISPPPPEVTHRVIDAVRQRGYTYVDAASLDADYSGSNPAMKGKSWWIRFFDYL